MLIIVAHEAALCYYAFMRTTVDLSDTLYRALKAKAALEGRTVREVLTQAVEQWLQGGPREPAPPSAPTPRPWIGGLREYARRAPGPHDMASIRASIAAARERGVL
jgi:hypothetical protein